jgi:hypothetical protein
VKASEKGFTTNDIVEGDYWAAAEIEKARHGISSGHAGLPKPPSQQSTGRLAA